MTESLVPNTGVTTHPTVPALDSLRAAMSPKPVTRSVPTTTGRLNLRVLAALGGGHLTETLVESLDGLTPGRPRHGAPASRKAPTADCRPPSGPPFASESPRSSSCTPVAALRWRHSTGHHVLADLATAGKDALGQSVRACDIGTAHRSTQVFLQAWPPAPAPARTSGRPMLPTPHARDGDHPRDRGTPPATALIRDDG